MQTSQLLVLCAEETRVLTESARNSTPFALGAHCNLHCEVCKLLRERLDLFYSTVSANNLHTPVALRGKNLKYTWKKKGFLVLNSFVS